MRNFYLQHYKVPSPGHSPTLYTQKHTKMSGYDAPMSYIRTCPPFAPERSHFTLHICKISQTEGQNVLHGLCHICKVADEILAEMPGQRCLKWTLRDRGIILPLLQTLLLLQMDPGGLS